MGQAVAFGRASDANVIFVDLGGNREASALVPLLLTLQERLRPKLVVLKCRALHAAALGTERLV